MSRWRNRGVTLKLGCPAAESDVGRREIKVASDESVWFSSLGLATGSAPLRLNVAGADQHCLLRRFANSVQEPPQPDRVRRLEKISVARGLRAAGYGR
jgi:NAD(P)H-nitrite reductase large subunit